MVEHVERQCKEKIEKIKEGIPNKPNLKYYLSRAVLEGTIKFKSNESILLFMQKIVKSYGSNGWDSLVIESRYSGKSFFSGLPIEELIELPQDYKKDEENYNLIQNAAYDNIKILEDNLKIVRLKIQVGSDESLQNLIKEIDSIGGNLTIMSDPDSNNLLLSNPSNNNSSKKD